ncbi:nucleotidyl transferase AbiEii/AbiGii toxin family protein [Sulfitobacter sp. M22]|uniref:nucleotidyl transferase AbiEii/AbiGii toxin family protein n=1 Tax=Sulfitobacter sp. M22 TaxID=2675332 RepID=UPI001F3C5E50|nr:nucleotidyl transferase AbiEii/AbiGii toxin family protein [Sulfitobacter sp. M22]MCF7728032.1 nucleotidyl transferase AbiEii/AbiGii toxin family protein [Sulfitobacter sp. M22]
MAETSNYFSLSDSDKIDALEAGASKLGRPADLLEKDIWVVWVLNALFDSALGESLVFKGGTSLSKVYKAIDRFSEDVDVTYDIRKIIPDLIDDPAKPYPPNRSQAKKWTEVAQSRLSGGVHDDVVPLLDGKIAAEGVGAELRLEGDNLYLDYRAVRSGTGYVRPTVLLEFGARSTGEPAERQSVRCDLAEAIGGLTLPEARPRVMKAERTFWEKATAVHAYCLRGTFRGGDRYARHWYDLDCLDQIGIAENALHDRVLANEVAEHKQHFFRETDNTGSVIDYQAAAAGSLTLVPSGAPLSALEEDYRKMVDAGLLQSDAISFHDLMERLSILQKRANAQNT